MTIDKFTFEIVSLKDGFLLVIVQDEDDLFFGYDTLTDLLLEGDWEFVYEIRKSLVNSENFLLYRLEHAVAAYIFFSILTKNLQLNIIEIDHIFYSVVNRKKIWRGTRLGRNEYQKNISINGETRCTVLISILML